MVSEKHANFIVANEGPWDVCSSAESVSKRVRTRQRWCSRIGLKENGGALFFDALAG